MSQILHENTYPQVLANCLFCRTKAQGWERYFVHAARHLKDFQSCMTQTRGWLWKQVQEAVHALTQLRTREQALRGKRAVQRGAVVEGVPVEIGRIHYARCADRWDKYTTFQEQMESGSHNRKIGKLGSPESNGDGAPRATNPELHASNSTEGSMSFDRNLAIRQKLRSIQNSISQPPWPIMGDQRMPLQQAATGEQGEVTHTRSRPNSSSSTWWSATWWEEPW